MIISINGKKGSGKDTIGKLIQEKRPDYNFKIKKFGHVLKQMASLLTGVEMDKWEMQSFKNSLMPPEWSKWRLSIDKKVKFFNTRADAEAYLGKDMSRKTFTLVYTRITYRQFLQWLGTDAIRNGLHKDTFVNALYKDYKPDMNWIITDMRFPNEYLRGLRYNAYMLRVIRHQYVYERALYNYYDLIEKLTFEGDTPTESEMDEYLFLPDDEHISETALDHIHMEIIENNYTVNALSKEVDIWLENKEL